MDDSQRRGLVTEYIYSNPGCNKESVVKALSGKLPESQFIKRLMNYVKIM